MANNNGRISLSVRQAAERLNLTRNTAAKAFHQLQEKGFIVMTRPAQLGLSGQAKTPTYEITEIAMPGEQSGRKHYRLWRKGSDFRVEKATTHNPRGRNGRSSCSAEACHGNDDEAVIKLVTNSKVPSSKS
jgi:DNA-binding transcriptional MocR family regulator